MENIKKFIRSIENNNTSLGVWIISIFAIIGIRNLLENISSNRVGLNQIASYTSAFIHYPIFYFVALLGFILLFYFLSPKVTRDIAKTSKVLSFGLILIWLTPLLDLLLTAGKGSVIGYMVFNPENPWHTIFYIFTRPQGITSGIQIELIAIFCLSSFYFFYKNRNFAITALNFISNYLWMFFLLSAPSLLVLIENFTKNYLNADFSSFNLLLNIPSFQKILAETSSAINYTELLALEIKLWDFVDSWFWMILLVIFLNVWFYLSDKNKFSAFWKNSRPERILYYLSLIFIGFLIALKLDVYIWNFSFFNILNLIVLGISLIASWLMQVNINDVYDIKTDSISNPKRPLIKNDLSVEDLKNYNLMLFLVIAFSALLLNYEILLLLAAWNAAYFIYSSPPFRLKCLPIFSNIFIGLAGAIAISMGFSLSSGGQWFDEFPTKLMIALIGILTLISYVKDIKDIEGDTAENIKTIPVVFGKKFGKLIISLLVLSATVLTSLLFNNSLLIIISIIFGIIAAFLINKKVFKESNLFILFFIYILLLLNF